MVAWFALAVAVVALVPWLVLAVALPRLWAKLEPQLRPLIQMFTPPATTTVETGRCSFRDADGSRCNYSAGHEGAHDL